MASLAKSPPRRHPQCWSKIPLELMRLVFERLGFADFERAKSVCSSWLSASKQSQPKNEIPWLILFPKNNNHVLLFNPEEKQKVYKTHDLGNDSGKSFCVATYRSWLLMVDYQDNNQYILHLLTRERIVLPSSESDHGVDSQVFWIDEKTKDYLIFRMFDDETMSSLKKGDSSWKQIPELLGIEECFNMVYKDHKLYCLNDYKLNIFDFSGETPLKVFRISVRECVHRFVGGYMRLPGILPCNQLYRLYQNNIVVTLGGDVLIVTSERPSMSKIWEFRIYKMDSSKTKKWEEIFSVEDEAILLDLGITVLAKDMEGIKRNSIYFNRRNEFDMDIFIYNLDTKKVEQPHQFVCSSIPCSDAQWLLPSFKHDD